MNVTVYGTEMEVDEDKGLDTESGLDGLTFDAKKEVVSGTLNCMIAWLTSPANSGSFGPKLCCAKKLVGSLLCLYVHGSRYQF